jgi:hypothetical protein
MKAPIIAAATLGMLRRSVARARISFGRRAVILLVSLAMRMNI